MKFIFSGILIALSTQLYAQNLQLHYDLRHTVDPHHNVKNFPTVYFEYFKAQDSTSTFIKPGAFFIKMQTDMLGAQNNIGKTFIQASQTFRFWNPKVFLSLQYSGGLGVTEPKQYSYYIANALSLGPSYTFQWKGAYFSTTIYYVNNMLKKPSHDFLYTFYWGRGFWNYKVEFNGDLQVYTLNKNQGDEATKDLTGKRVSFFGEPQLWFNIHKGFGVGSKVLLYYHVVTNDDVFQVYPTVAARVKF